MIGTSKLKHGKLNGESQLGFTLIEMLIACVLASLMSVAMIQILRSALVETRQVPSQGARIAESWLLKEQLEHDIANARAFAISSQSVTLGGFLSRDISTGLLTQRKALVTYRFVKRGNHGLLERIEQSMDTVRAAPPRSEVVWFGVGSFRVLPKSVAISDSTPTPPEFLQLGLSVLDGGMTLQLFDEQGILMMEIL